MSQPRRLPGPVAAAGVLLALASVGATGWYFARPRPEPLKPVDAATLDVYCSGRVDAAGQVIALEPGQPSRVVEVLAAEGATVTRDQPLIVFDASLADSRLHQAEAGVESADIDLLYAKRAKERFPTQKLARVAVVEAAAARAEAARKTLAQRREQQKLTPLGKAELEAAQAEVRGLEQLEAAERAQNEDFQKLDLELDLRIRAAEARKRLALSDKELAERNRADCVLKAPGPGTVLRLQATPGGIVSPGSPLPPVVFAPAGPLVVRAEVDQEALGRVAEGMAAEVSDENRPDGPRWTGRVKSVGRWVALRRSMVLEPGEVSDVRTVECVVELLPGGGQLWIGQRMRVRIVRGDGGANPAPAAAAR